MDDVIIGVFSGAGAGESYVVFGHRGLWPPSLALSSLNGSNGVLLEGITSADQNGWSVASAGDFNADGVDDVIIGAHYADPNGQSLAGESYVVFGHRESWPALLALSSLNGTNGVVLQGIRAGDESGYSVASAGDLNGDGVVDVIIGAPYAASNGQNSAGESYLLFGRQGSWPALLALSSLNGSNGVVLQGVNGGDNCGRSVASAGDVNGDGIDDVIIGACSSATSTGESYVVFGRRGSWPASLALSSLNGSNGFVLQGIDADDHSGISVASAGDINGDGVDDVIIGAYRADVNGQTDAGESYVVFGHRGSWPVSLALSSLNGTNGVVLQGIDANDNSGISVASAGDVNADGVDDVIIGAYYADPNGQAQAGESYVVFGHRESWPALLALSSLNGTNGVVLQGVNGGDNSGHSVASAGDINSDGCGDVVIGAYWADPNGRTDAGQSYVIFGGAEQFSANQMEIQSGQMIRLNQSNLAVDPIIGNRTFTVTNTSHINFVSTYNISQPLSNFTQQQITDGEILVIHDGSREAPSYTVSAEGITRIFSDVHPQQGNVSFSIGAPRISAPHREFNLSDLNGVNGFVINGIAAGEHSGWSVASAGDVNGDGLSDMLIGAFQANPGRRSNAGNTYLVFGYQGLWPAQFNLSSINGSNGVIFPGIDAGDWSGRSVTSAGDVNGDGLSDVLIGAHQADPNGQDGAGETYLVFGHQGEWPAQFNLSSINGSNGVILMGIHVDDNSGYSVASAGDVNGDRFSDVLIGAYGADPNGQDLAGETYLVFGHQGLWPAQFNLSSINGSSGVILAGIDAYDYSGYSVASAGDVNGDRFSDVLIGVYGADPNGQDLAGETCLVFGHQGLWPAQFNLSSINGSNGVILTGIDVDDQSGISVASAGDVNGDGLSDVLIGAFQADPGGRSNAGATYLVFGHQGLWPTQFNLSSINGRNGVILAGIDGSDLSGRSVFAAGDVNGDGLSDVLIGAYGADPGGRDIAGESYAVFGHNGSWPASMALSSINGSNGVVLQGIDARDYSGFSVSSIGDVNGDGFGDVIIGAFLADPDGRTDAGQSYVIFGGAEQFSTNEILIERGQVLTLNASNIEIAPNIDSRMINVTDVTHGRFALTSDVSVTINSFNQSQINNGEIVFVHDGSDQAPSYTVSAEGITRVFSNVHPQQVNVSFVLSTSTTTLTSTTSSVSSTVTDTTRTETSTTDTVTSAAPTVAPTVNPTSFFAVPTSAPTALINGGDEPVTNDNGSGGSDSSGLIIGVAAGVIGLLAFIMALGYIYYRRNEHEKQKAILAREAEGAQGKRTVAMTNNPLFVASANRMNVSGENAGYLTVGGAEEHYETPVSAKAGVVLDDDQYVVRPGESTTDPAQAYSIFRSPGSNRDGGVTTSKGPANEPGAYAVFRSAR